MNMEEGVNEAMIGLHTDGWIMIIQKTVTNELQSDRCGKREK